MKINNIPKVAIFDWDGTILDTHSNIRESVNFTLKSYNLPLWQELKEQGIINSDIAFKDNFKCIFGDAFTSAFRLYRERYMTSLAKVELFDHAKEVLALLKTCGVAIHIISNKDSYLLNKEVQIFFGQEYFDSVLGYDDVEDQKPSPTVVDYVLSSHENLDRPTSVFFIGDSLTDLRCAQNSNCLPIIVSNKTDNSWAVNKDDYVCFPSLRELFSVFNTFSAMIPTASLPSRLFSVL